MLVQNNQDVLDIFKEEVLFILPVTHDTEVKDKQDRDQETQKVKIYKRDGQIMEVWMTNYSLVKNSKLILDRKQLDILESMLNDLKNVTIFKNVTI